MIRFILLISVAILIGGRSSYGGSLTARSVKHPSNLGWLFGVHRKRNTDKEGPIVVCESEECKQISNVIQNSMDKSVDPCDDFYEYSCGKWEENNPTPEGKKSWSLWAMVQQSILEQVKEFLMAPPKPHELLPLKLSKKWFKSCMNEDAMERRGLEPVFSVTSRIGGWPMIMEEQEWEEYVKSWQKVDDYYVSLFGRNTFHSLNVRPAQVMNETGKYVTIDPPSLPPGSYRLWREMNKGNDKDGERVSCEEGDSDETSEERGSQEPRSEEKTSMERRKEDKVSKEKNSKEEENKETSDEENDDEENDGEENNDDENDDQTDDDEENDDENEVETTEEKARMKHRRTRKRSHNRGGMVEKKRKGTHKKHRVRDERIRTKRSSISKRIAYEKREQIRRKNGGQRIDKEQTSNKRRRAGKRGSMFVNNESVTENTMATTENSNGDEESKEVEELTAREKYKRYIMEVALAIADVRGTEISKEKLEEDVDDMIDFQQKLVNITMLPYETTNTSSLSSFQEWYDEVIESFGNDPNIKINWIDKVTKLFNEANVKIDEDETFFMVPDGDYFRLLPSVLAETSKRTIINFIHWNFIGRMLKTTTKRMRYLYDNWLEEKDEEADEIERGVSCAMEGGILDILAYQYVKEHFSDDISSTAMDMIDDIQKEVEYQIKESEWLDEETRDYVLSKLVNMDKLVGYPDWYKNETTIKYFLRGLHLGRSYFENTLSVDRFHVWKELRKLEMGNDEAYSWLINPLIVNAFFMPNENSITITAADFQNPFFAFGRPNTLNFGIVGFIMAHEVNHGFDDSGITYDRNGEAMEWLEVMSKMYIKRAECFVDQFNNYMLDKDKNTTIENYGKQTVGENIADTMGLQAVYRAYRRRERECGKPEASLPGLEEYSNDQLFFLSFANLWCESKDPEAFETASFDSHSTARLRVIGSVSNSEDFARAYNCPVGSPMNPEKKCNIWK